MKWKVVDCIHKKNVCQVRSRRLPPLDPESRKIRWHFFVSDTCKTGLFRSLRYYYAVKNYSALLGGGTAVHDGPEKHARRLRQWRQRALGNRSENAIPLPCRLVTDVNSFDGRIMCASVRGGYLRIRRVWCSAKTHPRSSPRKKHHVVRVAGVPPPPKEKNPTNDNSPIRTRTKKYRSKDRCDYERGDTRWSDRSPL